MEEVEAMDFYNRVVGSERDTKEVQIAEESGAGLTVTLQVVNRKDLLDEISRLPDEMLETISESEDADEAEENAEEAGLLSGVDGTTIEAFENICAKSLTHPEWTDIEVNQVVQQLDFEVLFPMGAEVIELSFAETGNITDFHDPSSDENS
jgi:hypothetical protein